MRSYISQAIQAEEYENVFPVKEQGLKTQEISNMESNIYPYRWTKIEECGFREEQWAAREVKNHRKLLQVEVERDAADSSKMQVFEMEEITVHWQEWREKVSLLQDQRTILVAGAEENVTPVIPQQQDTRQRSRARSKRRSSWCWHF